MLPVFRIVILKECSSDSNSKIILFKILTNDFKRITRILEIYEATGKTKTQQEILSRAKGVKYDFKVFALDMDREKLYERINLRVDIMFEQGLIDEVESIYKKYDNFPTAMQGLGYKEVVKYLNKEYSYDEMVDILKMETRRYAKRQLTWFRREDKIKWYSLDEITDKIVEDYNK